MIVVNYDKGFAKMSQPPAFRNVAGESELTEASRRRRAADERDELSPSHSITSSARASRVGEISRPSALATVRLKTSSNLVGCSTGRLLGLAPRKILST